LDGAPAGLTITGRLHDGTSVLADAVIVAPELDADGDALAAYQATFTAPTGLPVMLEWLDAPSIVGYELVTSATTAAPDGYGRSWLEGHAAGLTITALLVDGSGTLPFTVIVTPVLDSNGLPLAAYRADYPLPRSLPVTLQWFQGATLLATETITATATTIVTDLNKFRLELGDHPTPDVPAGRYVYLFNDSEIAYFLAKYDPVNLLLSVADACDALAARFSREFDFDANDAKSFKRSQKATMYREMAARLRVRAGGIPVWWFPPVTVYPGWYGGVQT
jgi:hypothetical protein